MLASPAAAAAAGAHATRAPSRLRLLLIVVVLAAVVRIRAAASSIEAPLTRPAPSDVLFVSDFDTATEINYFVAYAKELRERGHTCRFALPGRFVSMAERNGFETYEVADNLSNNPQRSISELTGQLSETDNDQDYLRVFGKIVESTAFQYEATITSLKSILEKTGVPDLIVTTFFSTGTIDYAHAQEIKYVVQVACPLGSLGDYEAARATPNSFLDVSMAEHLSFIGRLKRATMLPRMIMATAAGTTRLNEARARVGLPQYMDPLTNILGRRVVSPIPIGFDPVRKLLPTTHLIGFLASRWERPGESGAMSPDDQALWEWLDAASDGVVLVALGTLARVPQHRFAELMRGCAAFAQRKGPSAKILVSKRNDAAWDTSALGADVLERVRFEPWFNQRMVLAHRNTLAFVTHGGLASIGESVMSLVPMLVLPAFGDQPSNAWRLVELGVAERLYRHSFTAAEVAAKLEAISSSDEVAAAVRRLYQLNSLPQYGVSRGADVMEEELLVGSSHLQLAEASQSFTQQSFADVYLLLLLAGLAPIVAFAIAVRLLSARKRSSMSQKAKDA